MVVYGTRPRSRRKEGLFLVFSIYTHRYSQYLFKKEENDLALSSKVDPELVCHFNDHSQNHPAHDHPLSSMEPF